MSRVRPFLFGSHPNIIHEWNFYYFVGELAHGRWAIANIFGVLNFVGYVSVVILRKYSSIVVVFTNLNVGRKNF